MFHFQLHVLYIILFISDNPLDIKNEKHFIYSLQETQEFFEIKIKMFTSLYSDFQTFSIDSRSTIKSSHFCFISHTYRNFYSLFIYSRNDAFIFMRWNESNKISLVMHFNPQFDFYFPQNSSLFLQNSSMEHFSSKSDVFIILNNKFFHSYYNFITFLSVTK